MRWQTLPDRFISFVQGKRKVWRETAHDPNNTTLSVRDAALSPYGAVSLVFINNVSANNNPKHTVKTTKGLLKAEKSDIFQKPNQSQPNRA